jgi:hypothetical protein
MYCCCPSGEVGFGFKIIRLGWQAAVHNDSYCILSLSLWGHRTVFPSQLRLSGEKKMLHSHAQSAKALLAHHLRATRCPRKTNCTHRKSSGTFVVKVEAWNPPDAAL